MARVIVGLSAATDCVSLAKTEQYSVSIRNNVPFSKRNVVRDEAQEQGFERWLIGHACEIAGTPGVSVPGLRADTARYAAAAAKAGSAVLQDWLTRL